MAASSRPSSNRKSKGKMNPIPAWAPWVMGGGTLWVILGLGLSMYQVWKDREARKVLTEQQTLPVHLPPPGF